MNVEVKTLVIDWKSLRKLGWPYSRAHTHRLMAREIPDPKHTPKGVEEHRMIPNPDPFPQCYKLVNHRNAHPMWRVREVLAYFEAHGFAVSQDWQ